METTNILVSNLLSPVVLAFLLGVVATLMRSELEFPKPVLNAISIYLVFSVALLGGTEIAEAGWRAIWKPALAAVAVALVTPTVAFWVARTFIGLDIPNAAGMAALYGSVSSVTFLASMAFAEKLQTPAEPFLPALVTIMEWGMLVAILVAKLAMAGESGSGKGIRDVVMETLRGRSVVLLLGGLVIGYIIGPQGFTSVKPVFQDAFRGILVLFLLEMGMVAGRQLREFVNLGPRLVVFGIVMPTLHGLLGVALGHVVGLSTGGAFVFGAIAASASYIDAPAAVRVTFPQANPSIYLTSSLGITFPFNLLLGLPLYYKVSVWLDGLM